MKAAFEYCVGVLLLISFGAAVISITMMIDIMVHP